MRIRAALVLAALMAATNLHAQPAPARRDGEAIELPATPHLDELAAIDKTISGDRFLLLLYVKPTTAGLVLVDPPQADAREALVAWLESLQPVLVRATELSRQELEVFPPEPSLAEVERNDAHMRHPKAHAQHITMLLLADGARLFDHGSIDGALERAAATVRFGRSIAKQKEAITRIAGGRFVAQASLRIKAMASERPDLWQRVRPAAAKEIREAYSGVDPKDPDGGIGAWEAEAREAVAFCRARYAIVDGPAKYAAFLRENAIDEDTLQATDDAMRDLATPLPGGTLVELSPSKQFADKAAALAPHDIERAIGDAERAIPTIAQALRDDDAAALRDALRVVREDQTQVSRVVLSGSGVVLGMARSLRAPTADAIKAIDTLPRE